MPSLPVPTEYLMAALQDGYTKREMTLFHHATGDLVMPTGQLTACDPFVFSDQQPFKVSLPRGTFPVRLSIAHIKTDQRVAFATIHLSQIPPVSWEMLTVGNQDVSTLKAGKLFGYGVDAGTGCFMDLSASQDLAKRIAEEEDFCETLMEEMDKTYRHTWSWLDTEFGESNLIAFSSGYGDGFYATYAGRDSNGQLAVVVTDFGVLPLDKPPEQPTRKGPSSFVSRLFGKN